MRYHLVCVGCGTEYESDYDSQICRKCSGILEVIYDGKDNFRLDGESFWNYERSLPDGKYRKLALGSTPILKNLKHRNLLMKMEVINPTRSFKDRGSIVEISKAIEYGYKDIVCASTGNMAYSLSYYAAIHGIKAKVFVVHHANKDKIRDIRETGSANLTIVKGDFTNAQTAAINYAKRNKRSFLTGDYCYRKEGQKTVAYEAIAAVGDLDYMLVPVGNATLLSGILKALDQIKKTGKRVPKVIAVQSKECSPLVDAFLKQRKVAYVRPKTIADAIAVGMPTYGDISIRALRATGGGAIAIEDKDLSKEEKRFYERYGMIAEPASVSGLLAFEKMKSLHASKCLAVVTGGNI